MNPPWLYHPYAGHDNNRDGDFLNLVESKYAAKTLYRDWKPQAYIDHYHMGSYGARFHVPPYSEPMRPYDSATHTMAEFMGVRVDPIAAVVEAELVELTAQLPPSGTVEAGGTLVAFGDSTAFAIEKLELKVRNVIDEVPAEEFFCPGSTVKATFETKHPLAYGMPDEGLVLFWGSPTFQIVPSQHNERYETIVRYGDRDLLQSGWLIGEEHIANKAGMVVAKKGKGRVILIGFRTQNRSQTHGTFKLLFNALLQ